MQTVCGIDIQNRRKPGSAGGPFMGMLVSHFMTRGCDNQLGGSKITSLGQPPCLSALDYAD